MPERPRPPASRVDPTPWWCWLGRLLPTHVRERVYEPACYEHLRSGLEGPGRRAPSIALYAVAAFVAAASFNLPRVFFDGRRLSGLGKAMLVVVAVALAYAVTMARYNYGAS